MHKSSVESQLSPCASRKREQGEARLHINTPLHIRNDQPVTELLLGLLSGPTACQFLSALEQAPHIAVSCHNLLENRLLSGTEQSALVVSLQP